MIVKKREFIFILNDYHGNIRNFLSYFEQVYYDMQSKRIFIVAGYTILKQFTGISIPKLEEFMGITEDEVSITMEEAKQQFVDNGFIIED